MTSLSNNINNHVESNNASSAIDQRLLLTIDQSTMVTTNSVQNTPTFDDDDDLVVVSNQLPQPPSNNNHHPPLANGPKRIKLMSMCRVLTLRRMFYLLGTSVGSYPLAYVAVAMLLSSLSIGMFWMTLRDQIRDGYTPLNAQSRVETEIIREFWGSAGDPMMTVVILTAKDNGSMVRDRYLSDVVDLHRYLMENFTANVDGVDVRYRQLCEPYCDVNIALQFYKNGLDSQKSRLASGLPLASDTDLDYPISKIGGFEFHLDRTFFGVNLRSDGLYKNLSNNHSSKTNLSINDSMVTTIDVVTVILLVFRGDKSSPLTERRLSKWEIAVYEYCRQVYSNELIDMEVIGTEILDQEMIRDGQRMTPYFAAGFAFMAIFVSISVMASAVFYNEMDVGKLFVIAGAILCPVLAITTTYGIISLLGLPINSFMLVMPFLIMAIGVDDAFLMIHSWQRQAPFGPHVPSRLGLVFEEVGPSITITSLTNFIAFGIGALTPTPEIRLFCLATAIGMGLDYLFQLTLFGPALTFAAHCEQKKPNNVYDSPKSIRSPSGWRKKIDYLLNLTLKYYCRLIGNRIFTVILAILTSIYWYFAIYGAMSIKTRLDAVKILPKDSPIQRPNQILTDIVWAEYHPVTILLNSFVDIRIPSQLYLFNQMIDEYESIPQCKGKKSTLLWLRDYQKYVDDISIFDSYIDIDEELDDDGDSISFDGHNNGSSQSVDRLRRSVGLRNEDIDQSTNTRTGLDYEHIVDFLDSPFYRHWKAFVKLQNNSNKSTPIVSRFMFIVAYNNASDWQKRIDLMIRWRSIADKYSKHFNVTVWEANGMFVDQMLSLKSVTLQTVIITLLCMAVVCAIFIPNPCSVIISSIAIASISLGVFGFLSWWHFDLDPVTMAATLMSIGLSVDFTAHVSYHYQLTKRKELRGGREFQSLQISRAIRGQQEKLQYTLESVGWPMIQAGLSTIVCLLPLLFLQSYAPTVFLKTILLVVCWGLLHGLVVLPTFLGALPDVIIDANCYRSLLTSTTNDKSCRCGGYRNSEHMNSVRLGSDASEMQQLNT